MSTSPRGSARTAIVVLAIVATCTAFAGSRQAVPRWGGGGGSRMHSGGAARTSAHRAAVPRQGAGGTTAHRAPVPARGQVPAHGTANGIARYGYGYGYGGYYGYPCYGWGYPYWGYPYWGVGFYGSWYWPWYGDYYGGYYGGYGPYPQEQTYVMGDGPAPQMPATIITRISPSSAEVLLDDQPVGYAKDYNGAWDSLSASPGRHTLTFRRDGYTTLKVEIDAKPGARYVFDNQLVEGEGEDLRALPPPSAAAPSSGDGQAAPQAPRGRMKIHALPDDAAVYLDGEYLGMAGELARLHGAIPVATGPHQLEIVRPGYATHARTVEVGPDVATVDVTLERAR